MRGRNGSRTDLEGASQGSVSREDAYASEPLDCSAIPLFLIHGLGNSAVHVSDHTSPSVII